MTVSPLLQTTFLPFGTIATAVLADSEGPRWGRSRTPSRLRAGQLPAGLTVNASTLVLGGVPVESGNFNPVFTYTDSASHSPVLDSSLIVNAVAATLTYRTTARPTPT